jgi:hypothetical protein
MSGGQHRDDEVTRTELVGLDRDKNSRIVAHRPSEKTTGLHNCRGVCETNKTELNTLDEADFVRDVDKSAYHQLSVKPTFSGSNEDGTGERRGSMLK